MYSKLTKYCLLALLYIIPFWTIAQDHPRIYITDAQKNDFLNRIEESERIGEFIKQIREGFEIDSPQPFILTIPLSEKEKGVLESINQDQNRAFKGKVIKQDKIRLAAFELPALNRVKFKLY